MIDYISGEIAELTPTYAVIDNHGMGYMLSISLNSYSALQNAVEAKLYVYEAIREDAYALYGFAEKVERELFEQLISVSGVGAASARMILSTFRPSELKQIIASANSNMLKSVKGIGAKTAQRIIVDLKDKINMGDDSLDITVPSSNESFEEALAALVMLGFPKPVSQKALKKLYTGNPAISVEDAIKQALKMM